ncbi:ABC transporter [Clostridium putrefaciens]|uniref:ABC transporter n=1 Tax=Clostridium putrefaciens TaxID=99675 RepID=A0A381JB56_9CLOT|nr:ATP-binding cassette domain-containing protein [Clostridium putrefaciens]SUY48500.1 ABC transporter [Clostridium putrefaciens]
MIEIFHLTKKYKSLVAINDVSFSIKPGTITGFVGPNGAGKSTTLRCIVGLTTPTSGTTTVFGTKYNNLKNPSRSIGVVLDASSLHPGRSGYSTLKIASTINGVPDSRIEQVLEECGLTPLEGKRKIKSYSLGMRQRLCIAQALLANPKILILDEPVNGLDPHGIRWIRSILRKFVDDGGTVLLSSHLLSEVQKIADHVVMICGGKILADKPLKELLAEGNDLEEIYIKYTEQFYRRGAYEN